MLWPVECRDWPINIYDILFSSVGEWSLDLMVSEILLRWGITLQLYLIAITIFNLWLELGKYNEEKGVLMKGYGYRIRDTKSPDYKFVEMVTWYVAACLRSWWVKPLHSRWKGLKIWLSRNTWVFQITSFQMISCLSITIFSVYHSSVTYVM